MWAQVALCLTLAAFAVQSFVIQTHIHFDSRVEAAFAASARAGSRMAALPVNHQSAVPSNPKKNSSSDDPAKCPLCQEYLYAGNYVAPAAIALILPSANVSAIVPETPAAPRVLALSHSWQGRAPPSV